MAWSPVFFARGAGYGACCSLFTVFMDMPNFIRYVISVSLLIHHQYRLTIVE